MLFFWGSTRRVGSFKERVKLKFSRSKHSHAPHAWLHIQRFTSWQAAEVKGSALYADNLLLTGRIFNEHGNRLTPVHATNHAKRYRYYVTDHKKSAGSKTESWRIAATVLEPIVERHLIQILKNRSQLTRWIPQYSTAQNMGELPEKAETLDERIITDQSGSFRAAVVRMVFKRITVASNWLRYDIDMLG